MQHQIERFNERISEIDKSIEELANERIEIVNKLNSVFQTLGIKCPINY